MKKSLLALPLVVLALSACNATQHHSPANTPAAAVPNTQVLNFVGPMDLTIRLESKDNFETAIMQDNSDRQFQMRSVPAASGIRMENGQGVSIHFKNGDGTVELVPGKPISIQAFPK